MVCVLKEFNETVPVSLSGERLDRLLSFISSISRSEASKLIRGNGVSVNGNRVDRPSFKVSVDDFVEFSIDDSEIDLEITPDASIDFEIVHSDSDFLVVNKPAGLVVHPGAGNSSGTLVNGLLAYDPKIEGVGQKNRPGIIHRLDKGTSGLLLVATTNEAYQFFLNEMQERNIERMYKALVWGLPDGPEGIVDAPIGRSSKNRKKMGIVSNGKPSRSLYRVLKSWDFSQVSLLEIELETGRTHQIRVHLSSIGNPVVGDEVYGGRRKDLGLERQFLHAYKLCITHPRTGSICEFESSLPEELNSLLDTFDENVQ